MLYDLKGLRDMLAVSKLRNVRNTGLILLRQMIQDSGASFNWVGSRQLYLRKHGKWTSVMLFERHDRVLKHLKHLNLQWVQAVLVMSERVLIFGHSFPWSGGQIQMFLGY